MSALLEVRHISVSIQRAPQDVYRFVSDPRNLPLWASGLSAGIRNVAGEWVSTSPLGEVKVRFTEPNALGVLDHDVVLPSGVTVHNPLRVLRNAAGAEVIFSLFRQPDMSAEEFAEDAEWVEKDLRTLKSLLE